MRTSLPFTAFLFLAVSMQAQAADPVSRWCNAAGGRDKVAAIKAIYREASIHVAGFDGVIKAWHTSDGRYRKEEQIGPMSTLETFDGTTGTLRKGNTPPRTFAGDELARARTSPFANSNAIFFVFFPERLRGTRTLDGNDTIVFQPEGGIDWRVTLDPETSLPKTMVHSEGGHTVTVTFVSYEVVDGIKLEKEIHRTMGDPRYDADIVFTKTVINPTIDASLFKVE